MMTGRDGHRPPSWMLEGNIPHVRDCIFYLHTNLIKISWSIAEIRPKQNSKQRPLAAEFYFRFQFQHVLLQDTCTYDHIKFQRNDTQTTEVPTVPFTKPDAHVCHNEWSADPETPKMVKSYLMADSESGSPVSYSSFLVTTCLFRLVSILFIRDRQMNKETDGRTMRTITIAGYTLWRAS